MSMQDLIVRLEQATGPNRDLDRDLWFCLVPEMEGCWPHWSGLERRSICPRFTGSIDIALALIPKGMCWLIAFGGFARITRGLGDEQVVWSVTAATPAIAMCVAALKARSSAT